HWRAGLRVDPCPAHAQESSLLKVGQAGWTAELLRRPLMQRRVDRRPSLATLISIIALFIALGGTSYAAATGLLPKNSVGSAQVINRSLQKGDLSRTAVASLRGNRGPRGLQGIQGDPGAAGPAGPTGPKGDKGATGDPWTLNNGLVPSGKVLRGVFGPGGTAPAAVSVGLG